MDSMLGSKLPALLIPLACVLDTLPIRFEQLIAKHVQIPVFKNGAWSSYAVWRVVQLCGRLALMRR